MTTLKEAIKKGKLSEFIKERSNEKGDSDKFERVISSMVGKSKATPATSDRETSARCNDTQTRKRTSKGAAKKPKRESRE